MVKTNLSVPINRLSIRRNEDLVNLYSTALQVAKDDRKAAQQYLAGIVLHIIGMILSYSQNKDFEDNNMGQIVERAKIIMSENMHKGINVEVLASKLGISYSRFRKVLKIIRVMLPDNITGNEIKKGKRILVETNRSLKEIS